MIYLDVTEQAHFVFWICKYYQCILCDSSHKIKVFTYLYLEIVINKNEEFHVENRIFSISIKLKYVKILIPMKHFFFVFWTNNCMLYIIFPQNSVRNCSSVCLCGCPHSCSSCISYQNNFRGFPTLHPSLQFYYLLSFQNYVRVLMIKW